MHLVLYLMVEDGIEHLITCSFGFQQLRQMVQIKNATGQTSFGGNGTDGLFAWGQKLTKGLIDPYAATSGEVFYADTEYNIKTYTINKLEDGYMMH